MITMQPKPCAPDILAALEETDGAWIVQEKMDGVRCLAQCGPGGQVLTSRQGVALSAPQITSRECVLDGELMPNGVFFAFDMLAIDGENLRGLPAIERLMRLEYEAPCPVVRSTGSGLLAFYRAIIQNGGEGVVAKRASSLYRVGRSYDWLKVKPKYEVKNV